MKTRHSILSLLLLLMTFAGLPLRAQTEFFATTPSSESLESRSLLSLLDANRGFVTHDVTLAGTGHPNAGYVLQATTDLQTWTPVSGVLTSPTGAIAWQFNEPATLTRRCYRFLLQ